MLLPAHLDTPQDVPAAGGAGRPAASHGDTAPRHPSGRGERCRAMGRRHGLGLRGGRQQWPWGSSASPPAAAAARLVLSRGRQEELKAASLQGASQLDHSGVARCHISRVLISPYEHGDGCLRTPSLPCLCHSRVQTAPPQRLGDRGSRKILLSHGLDDKPTSETVYSQPRLVFAYLCNQRAFLSQGFVHSFQNCFLPPW